MFENIFPYLSNPRPFAHEATLLVSSTALALDAFKWGTVTVSGDTGTQLASWSLKGVNKNNSNKSANGKALTLWWKLSDSAGTRTVSVYKNPARASDDLVAQGTNAGDGTVTLTAQNSSGIYGSVAVTYTADDTDAGNTIAIHPRADVAKVTFDSQPVRYWLDNTVPTANDGLYAAANTMITLGNSMEIMNFRVIRQGSSDSNMSVSYHEVVV